MTCLKPAPLVRSALVLQCTLLFSSLACALFLCLRTLCFAWPTSVQLKRVRKWPEVCSVLCVRYAWTSQASRESCPCLHSCCRACIDKMSVTAKVGGKLSCPVCRFAFRLPSNGAMDLPKDVTKRRIRKRHLSCGLCDEQR